MKCPHCHTGTGKKNGGGRARCISCGLTWPIGKEGHEKSTADEIKALRNEVKRLSEVSTDLAAIRRIVGSIDANIRPDAPGWTALEPTGHRVHGIPTLMLSDLHFGEVVRGSEVNGVNSYSTATAKRRLQRVALGAVKLLKETLSAGEFGGMVVQLGGDMVDGVIHDELRDTADQTAIEAVITLHDELVGVLKLMADEFGKVHVPCVTGNHGRLDRKPRAKTSAKLNFDWLLYQFLARTLATDERISFQIPDGRDCVYKIHGIRYLLTHGDTFRGGSGITGPLLPWMRGDAKTRKAYAAQGLPYDILCMGHWHQLRYLGQIIVNGSLVGYNEYALRERFDFEPPQQALWLTHPVRGLTFQEAVFAEDAKPVKSTSWVQVPR